MELTVFQTLLLLLGIGLVLLAGLCWCFCCGTCVGKSLLRSTGLLKFARDGQWKHLPNHHDEEEELWHLQTWEEEDEEEENEEDYNNSSQ